MAGRKPKPTALKKLEGNPGKRVSAGTVLNGVSAGTVLVDKFKSGLTVEVEA